MKSLVFILLTLTLASFTLSAQQSDKKEIKTFIFGEANITGTNSKPAQSNINVMKGEDLKTKIIPRDNFLPELSSSVDEI